MKHTFTLISIVVLSFVLSACNAVAGDGNVVTEEFDVSGFNQIHFDGVGDVFITVDEEESLSITTDENLQELMEGEVRDGTLHIGQLPNTAMYNPTELTFTVTVTELELITISGSGDLTLDNFEGDSLTLEISGSSDVFLEDIELETLNITVDGSSDVEADGEAQTLNLDISGSGNFAGFDLETTEATVDISGSGGAEVNVSDQLSGEISGSGDLIYQGEPDLNVDVNGSGEIESDD